MPKATSNFTVIKKDCIYENFKNNSSLQIPDARGPTFSPYKRKEISTYEQVVENLIQGTYAVKPAEPVTEYKYLNSIMEFLDKSILTAAEKFTVSRKVFVSSLPKNWKRDVIETSFRRFGALTIQWCKNNYLIDRCLSVLVSKTPFNAKAAQLAEAVEKIFPGVACVKIITDEMYDYPTGYARIFFTNEDSYEKCISEQYVSLEFNDKERRVKFIPFDEQLCHTGNFSQDNSRDVTLEAPTSQTATIRLEWDRPIDEYFKNKINSQSPNEK
ncbi:hypothetical protein D917_05973 [Trichinella nativa]|uniref:RRM domain-containing protein n=1 Tax=Trichinella nativa TaxID=6335 RepID=A0A1Y3EUG2_9BILA|nr:hypothetical protein D917_05973 [Trichinella nativa]